VRGLPRGAAPLKGPEGKGGSARQTHEPKSVFGNDVGSDFASD
jgi:hypothetical protein